MEVCPTIVFVLLAMGYGGMVMWLGSRDTYMTRHWYITQQIL